jgi:hypothetical protein
MLSGPRRAQAGSNLPTASARDQRSAKHIGRRSSRQRGGRKPMNQLTGPRGDVASHFVGRLVLSEDAFASAWAIRTGSTEALREFARGFRGFALCVPPLAAVYFLKLRYGSGRRTAASVGVSDDGRNRRVHVRQPRRIASIALSAVARSNCVRFSAIMP